MMHLRIFNSPGYYKWIYVAVLLNTFLQAFSTSSVVFVTQPKLEPYFVKAGDQNLVLPCAIDADLSSVNIRWMRTSHFAPPQIVAEGSKVRSSAFELDCQNPGSQPGCYNLRFKTVTFERSNGAFYCQVEAADIEHSSMSSNPAKVTVLVPPGAPNITDQPTTPIKDSDVVQFKCKSVGGNPAPLISWTFANNSNVNALSLRQENATNPDDATVSILSFIATSSENSAVVLCHVTHPALESKVPDASSAPLTVNFAPRVKLGPVSPYNVEAGDSISLICDAQANPPVSTYSWTFNDLPLLTNSDSRSLNLTVHKNSSGAYTCIAEAASGLGQSRLRLNVFYGPEIQLDTQYKRAVGESFQLVCSANAFPPVNKVSWTGPNGFVSDSDTISIPQVTLADMGNYTCQVSNDMPLYIGNTARTTQRSTLLMIDHKPGKGIVRPVSIEPVTIGSAVNLTCTSDDPGIPTAMFKWRSPLQTTFQQGASFLMVESAKLTDSGLYACLPFNSIGDGEPGDYRLIVYVPAQMESTTMTNDTKSEGDLDQKLYCSAVGHPPPNITWFKDQEIHINADKNAENHWKTSQIIDATHCENNDTCLFKVTGILAWQSPISWSDKGVYECMAFNGAGRPVSSTHRLSVNHRPVIINDRQRAFVAVEIRQQSRLSCRVNARPEPTFKWMRDGSEVAGNGGEISIESRKLNEADDIYESHLTLKSVQDLNMGEYTCKAVNQIGEDSIKITLQLKTKPMDASGFKVLERTRTTALLSWAPGFDGGEMQVFTVEIRQMISGVIRRDNVTKSTLDQRNKRFVGIEKAPEMFYNVSDLLPDSDYKFRLKSSNRLGETEWSESVGISTSEALIESSIPKLNEGSYNHEQSSLMFKPTNMDPAAYCLLLYRMMPSGKMMVENCYSTSIGTVEKVKPAASYKIRFCRRSDFVCGPDFLISATGDGPFSWQILMAIVAVLLFLFLAGAAILFFCYRNRRNDDKKSPQLSTSSSIVGGQVPKNVKNMTTKLDGNATSASKDSGMYTGSVNGSPSAAAANVVRYDAAAARRYSAAAAGADGSSDSAVMDLSPAVQTSGGGVGHAYDHTEHWGATDGYGSGAKTDSAKTDSAETFSMRSTPSNQAADYGAQQRRVLKEIIV